MLDEVYILFYFNIIAPVMLHNNTKDFQHLKKKRKAIRSFETSEKGNPATQRQVPEDRNPTLHLCEKAQTHRLPIKCASEISCSHIQATCPTARSCKALRPFQDHYFDALCQ